MKQLNFFLGGCLDNLDPKNILDLGIGKGRRSIKFLEKGSQITGVDKKKQTLPQNINFILSDIRDFKFPESYDLIISSMVLHFFKKEEAIELINSMKQNTASGGHNFILNMTPEDSFAKQSPKKFYVSEDELKKLYSGWEIIECYSFETPIEEHGGLPPHKHFLTGILAKKIKE
jgi:SAM-dependent methyltransferase